MEKCKPFNGGLDSLVPGNLAAFRRAFLKAKTEFQPVKATKSNPFFHSKYADLSDYHAAVDAALSKNGFTVHQIFESSDGRNYLTTKLCHIEGWEESSRILIASKDDTDPQKVGSCITYLRRYSLSALLGIPVEDDDGNTASQPSKTTVLTNVSSDFVFKFGKYKDKRFDDIPSQELQGYLQWLAQQKDPQKNKHIFDAYEAWSNQKKHKDYDEPPPIDDVDLSNIPF